MMRRRDSFAQEMPTNEQAEATPQRRPTVLREAKNVGAYDSDLEVSGVHSTFIGTAAEPVMGDARVRVVGFVQFHDRLVREAVCFGQRLRRARPRRDDLRGKFVPGDHEAAWHWQLGRECRW